MVSKLVSSREIGYVAKEGRKKEILGWEIDNALSQLR